MADSQSSTSCDGPSPPSSEPPDDDDDQHLLVFDDFAHEEFVESDPSRRYGRYSEILGKGAMKTVYRAYDRLDCKEVAWNKARVIPDDEQITAAVEREVHLLSKLKHDGIIRLYSAWVDEETGTTNFITELCSATLLGYRKKHKDASRRAVKSWARQILTGLAHLHAQNPPIIHRDLKCENIFIKCTSNPTLKIGDFGSAAVLDETKHLHTLVGTPEFMSPEMFQEDYNELVDVYSFGMCLLELLTRECPYSECKNVAHIYKKVTSGVKPESLRKIKDVQALHLINRCLLPAAQRPSATDLLLSDPFLQCGESLDTDLRPVEISNCLNLTESRDLPATIPAPKSSAACVVSKKESAVHDASSSSDKTVGNRNTSSRRKDCYQYRRFQVTGKVENETTIRLKLRIEESGRVQDIQFSFDLTIDSPASVAEEMVRALEYPHSDMITIADLISAEIAALAAHAENPSVTRLVSVADKMGMHSAGPVLQQESPAAPDFDHVGTRIASIPHWDQILDMGSAASVSEEESTDIPAGVDQHDLQSFCVSMCEPLNSESLGRQYPKYSKAVA